jgi:hypothetical protein
MERAMGGERREAIDRWSMGLMALSMVDGSIGSVSGCVGSVTEWFR